MAMKDWKREKDEYNRPTWTSKNMGIQVFKSGSNYIFSRWEINDGFWGKEYPFIDFKTKSQALAYAKSYMRTH